VEIAENLNMMKKEIDRIVYNNVNVVSNIDWFKQDVLSSVTSSLENMSIKADIDDLNNISNLISNEYIHQYQNA
jgi:hypothetical protein